MPRESLDTVQDRFSEFVDRVSTHRERVVITHDGLPAAVLINPEVLESLEETLAVLSDPDAMADIEEARRALREGDVIQGVEAVRALRRR